jgi:putative restriction endonuclease
VQFDPVESKRVKGFVRAAKLDKAIFAEISGDWENFAVESEQLLHQYRKTANPLNNSKINNVQIDEIELPVGYAKEQITRVRIGQQFFRATVLSSYNHQCCITGLSNDLLLIASHIKPWKDSDSKTERTNPRNGLCLSPLYDKAFDAGLMTVDEQYRIVFDKQLFSCVENTAANYFFKQYHGKPLNLPERFLLDQLFLEYHRNNIFINSQSLLTPFSSRGTAKTSWKKQTKNNLQKLFLKFFASFSSGSRPYPT